MVDVSGKQVTRRSAHARCAVLLPPAVCALFAAQAELQVAKGPVISTAIIAGTLAVKQTSGLIPLCHPLPIDRIAISIQYSGERLSIDCRVSCEGKTGVEMEALTGCSVAALTCYDMLKAVSHRMRITDLRLCSKEGGKTARTTDSDEEDNGDHRSS
jgi:cyclic pyranopterin phosphate synthase